MRTAGLALSFALFSAPLWARLWFGIALSFPVVTLLCVVLMFAITWQWAPAIERDRLLQPHRLAQAIVAIVALTLVAFGAHRFVRLVLDIPIDAWRSDMLVIIRQALQRFASGQSPYGKYFVPWEQPLPYGPVLWLPFGLPQLLHIDLRALTLIGELVTPVWAGVAAVTEAGRRRYPAALLWLVLLSAIVFNPDVARFTFVGHTPVYWPLFLPFAALVVGERWVAAAVVLGLLVVGRSTMVAIVPVFFMAVWLRDRGRSWRALVAFGLVVAVLVGPFFLWDPAAMYDGMFGAYRRVNKALVWASPNHPVQNSIGLTGVLLTHHLERFAELAQIVLTFATWALAWFALRRGRPVLPWMAFALLVFSMTTLWPVYYVYFDVLLLYASAAIAEAVRPQTIRRGAIAWAATLAAVVAGLMVVFVLSARSFPAVEKSEISGSNARVQLPRRSLAAADVHVAGTLTGAPQQVIATLNGIPVDATQFGSDRWGLLIHVPSGVWILGNNELRLDVAPASIALRQVTVVRTRPGAK